MLVTILIPNYKTVELTKLCLRLIRKYTDPMIAKVIVIDNDSQDASTEYLRTLSWIELIERKAIAGELPALSHARALDLGLERVTTPYVLSIHTDTLVKHPKWLEFLLSAIEKKSSIAGVGSWKLESRVFWRHALKVIERQWQLMYFRVRGKTNHQIEGVGENFYYLRSHCALYRTPLLKHYRINFAGDDTLTQPNMHVGKEMHRRLVNLGYEMVFLPSENLIKYIEHINHATMILNPEFNMRKKGVKQGLKRIEKSLQQFDVKKVLMDSSLDL